MPPTQTITCSVPRCPRPEVHDGYCHDHLQLVHDFKLLLNSCNHGVQQEARGRLVEALQAS